MRYTISSVLAILAAGALSPARAEVPQVITDFPPVYGLVATVMGDLGQPGLLLDKGANAHSFQLRPSQASALADAGLVVWVGPEMSPWLGRTLDGFGQVRQLRLLAVPGSHLQEFGAGHEAHDHDEGHEDHDDHAHDHHDHDDHAGHSHDGIDPHAWLDPANGAVWLDAIAASLSGIDPENAATYAANAGAGKLAIAAADQQIAATLAPLHDKPFVVFHDAYGYFAGHYGLTVAGSVALGDATLPGAAHLRELQEKAGGTGALCLFPEVGHDPKLVNQLAEATGVRIGPVLDPEGADIGAVPDAYIQVLQGLATALHSCLTK